MSVVCAIWVYVTPLFKDSNNEYPFNYYIICLLINAVHSVFIYTIFVAQVSFFAKVSDKKIGGTYMTFLNTMSNLGKLKNVFILFLFKFQIFKGGNWPTTSALYLASYITIKNCVYKNENLVVSNGSSVASVITVLEKNFCSTDDESKVNSL
jgi:PAT family acetyl-CoA transporter-like MFS transporter 1